MQGMFNAYRERVAAIEPQLGDKTTVGDSISRGLYFSESLDV